MESVAGIGAQSDDADLCPCCVACRMERKGGGGDVVYEDLT